MSAKPKPQTTEVDHIRNTLSDLVESVGQGNSDIKQIQQHLLKHDERFDALEYEVRQNQQENRERFDKIEDTLAIIVNHLKK